MFTFEITPDGGETFRVVAGSRVITHWERTGRGRSIGQLDSNPRMTDLEELAYLAAERAGKFTGSIADFRESCDFEPIETDGARGAADPTRRAR